MGMNGDVDEHRWTKWAKRTESDGRTLTNIEWNDDNNQTKLQRMLNKMNRW
jgi:hypothetical protein